MDISLIILAGGKSNRMGMDKTDLIFQKRTFLENQIIKGKKLGIKEILVSGYKGENCQEKIVFDSNPCCGPLGGIETCLRKIKNEYAMVLGVDIPLIPEKDLKALISIAERTKESAVILTHNGKEEPLIGIYHKSLADEMHEEIEKRKGSVFALLNRVGYEVCETDTPEEYFINVNCPDEYQKIIEMDIHRKV